MNGNIELATSEIANYAGNRAIPIIKNGWTGQPPITPNREILSK
ncbi:hypothetical protein [Oceanobacillus sp. Castelsardo]|nr:hypothetical protein [Oceanobacillus sp. Castelsardo]